MNLTHYLVIKSIFRVISLRCNKSVTRVLAVTYYKPIIFVTGQKRVAVLPLSTKPRTVDLAGGFIKLCYLNTWPEKMSQHKQALLSTLSGERRRFQEMEASRLTDILLDVSTLKQPHLTVGTRSPPISRLRVWPETLYPNVM